MIRVALLLLLAACTTPDPCAGSRLAARGLVLDEDHFGWGNAECFDCHVAARIHQSGCLPEGAVDPEGWQDFPTACTSCHGGNGTVVDTGGAR